LLGVALFEIKISYKFNNLVKPWISLELATGLFGHGKNLIPNQRVCKHCHIKLNQKHSQLELHNDCSDDSQLTGFTSDDSQASQTSQEADLGDEELTLSNARQYFEKCRSFPFTATWDQIK